MIKKMLNSILDFFDDVKTLFTNDEYVSLGQYNYSYSPPKDEFKSEVINDNFYIEEKFDIKELKVKFTVCKKCYFYDSITGEYKTFKYASFDTLNEAKEVLGQLKKYKKPIIHYD
jgi:hypothetical protein